MRAPRAQVKPRRALLVLFLSLMLLAPAAPLRAQDAVNPQRMGEFMGLVLACSCLPYEKEHQAAAFYALMVEEEGERYADTAAGYMRHIQDSPWILDTACSGHICGNDFTAYLGEILAMIDLETEPDVFMDAYEEEYGAGEREEVEPEAPDGLADGAPADRWSTFCRTSPSRPECRTTDD